MSLIQCAAGTIVLDYQAYGTQIAKRASFSPGFLPLPTRMDIIAFTVQRGKNPCW